MMRQSDSESGTFAGFADDRDRAAHKLAKPLADGQS
jgi:hypothetical protein